MPESVGQQSGDIMKTERTELHQLAEKIIEMLNEFPEVKHCSVYGSLVNGTHDELSDIDIEIDVSGCDNGQFMLGLADRLQDRLNICYSDYAPSQIPENGVVGRSCRRETEKAGGKLPALVWKSSNMSGGMLTAIRGIRWRNPLISVKSHISPRPYFGKDKI